MAAGVADGGQKVRGRQRGPSAPYPPYQALENRGKSTGSATGGRLGGKYVKGVNGVKGGKGGKCGQGGKGGTGDDTRMRFVPHAPPTAARDAKWRGGPAPIIADQVFRLSLLRAYGSTLATHDATVNNHHDSLSWGGVSRAGYSATPPNLRRPIH